MSYTILIADDSAIVRTMVKKSIGMAGLPVGKVFEAANGKEALEVLARNWVDIVFADLNMPEMGGTELVERMSQDSMLVTTPVVIVSSEQSQVKIDELKAKGIRAYIKKPFRPEGFREVVDKVLGPTAAPSKENAR
jgi:two-component system chemotaxis response regulator CheY